LNITYKTIKRQNILFHASSIWHTTADRYSPYDRSYERNGQMRITIT
jgi:hypothetical protein